MLTQRMARFVPHDRCEFVVGQRQLIDQPGINRHFSLLAYTRHSNRRTDHIGFPNASRRIISEDSDLPEVSLAAMARTR